MRFRPLLTLAAIAVLTAAAPAGAATPEFVPGEVIVKYEEGSSASQRAHALEEAGTAPGDQVAVRTRTVEIVDGEGVRETVDELEDLPGVARAVPNYVARATGFVPNDPGAGGPGGWQDLQWNFLAHAGVNASDAWSRARAMGAPGGRGATVALLDTGVAYETRGRFRRAPDLIGTRFVPGYDFVQGDTHPNDENGHGTHVAGTIAQRTNNGVGVTGLAYRASVMPVRVLDREGEGDAASISEALRFAVKRGADVINLSLEFDRRVRASYIPDVLAAIRYARKRGVVVVAASGNEGGATVAYPARADQVIAVSGITHRLCLAAYSNHGQGVDLTAPGGGLDSQPGPNPRDQANCRPGERGRFIYQQTFVDDLRRFSLPMGYEGTSMASPHVAATAALIIATRRLGASPSPTAVERRIKQTARDLGPDGYDTRYGAGLVDAAAALAP